MLTAVTRWGNGASSVEKYRRLTNTICFLLLADFAAMSLNIHIDAPNVIYSESHITAQYSYQTTSVHREGNKITVRGIFLQFITQMDVSFLIVLHMWTRWVPAPQRWLSALRDMCLDWGWCWWAGEATMGPQSQQLYWPTSWVLPGEPRLEWRCSSSKCFLIG